MGEQSVPMTIMSRHVAQACNLSRQFFDAAASHGGALGKTLCSIMHQGTQELWRNVNTPVGRALPARCNREWFQRTFCSSTSSLPSKDEDIWPAVEKFRVYSCLGLCAAIPVLSGDFLNPMKVRVRSATHHVLGLSAENHGVMIPINFFPLVSVYFQR